MKDKEEIEEELKLAELAYEKYPDSFRDGYRKALCWILGIEPKPHMFNQTE